MNPSQLSLPAKWKLAAFIVVQLIFGLSISSSRLNHVLGIQKRALFIIPAASNGAPSHPRLDHRALLISDMNDTELTASVHEPQRKKRNRKGHKARGHQKNRKSHHGSTTNSSALHRSSSSSSSPLACEWKDHPIDLIECHQLLSQYVKDKSIWYFIGDSTMRFLFKEVHMFLNERVVAKQRLSYLARTKNNTNFPSADVVTGLGVIKSAKGRCGAVEYFGFHKAKHWIAPNHTLGEGPTKNHPYCSEATSVNVRMGNQDDKTISNKRENDTFQIELITVEYSLDVELPTLQSRTTQETVALYLANENQHQLDDTVCLVNTGVHDAKLQPYMTPDLYVTNTEQYLQLIRPYCGILIWLGISAVSNKPRFRPQRNENLIVMDDRVNDCLDQYNHNLERDKEILANGKASSANGETTRVARKISASAKDSSNISSSLSSSPSSPPLESGVITNILRIDVWNKSFTSPHKDHVHLSPAVYYKPLGLMFANLIYSPTTI